MNIEHKTTDETNRIVVKLRGPECLDPFTEPLVRMGLLAYVALRYPLRTSFIGSYRPGRVVAAITEKGGNNGKNYWN